MFHLPSVSAMINNIFKKENVDDGKIMTRVIYNSRYNLITLVSYSSPYFYTIIEFIKAASEIDDLKIHLAHSAKEKELSKEEQDDFDKKKIEIIDNRYYMILSGKPEDYAELYNHCDLENEVLKLLMDDIYNNCSSPQFQTLINYGIMSLGNFKYKGIVPDNYNKPQKIKFSFENREAYFFTDDYDLITKNIPEAFIMMDLTDIINTYRVDDKNPEKAGAITYNLKSFAKMYESITPESMQYKVKLGMMGSLIKYVYPYFLVNPTVDTLNILNAPLFMREDLSDLMEGSVPVEQLDELFQQEYDRFVQPTADAIEYEDIDEQIGLNDESENMRKEDILLDDTD